MELTHLSAVDNEAVGSLQAYRRLYRGNRIKYRSLSSYVIYVPRDCSALKIRSNKLFENEGGGRDDGPHQRATLIDSRDTTLPSCSALL